MIDPAESPILNPSPILSPKGHLMELESAVIGNLESKILHPWKRARFPYAQKFLLNHAFLNGRQYIRHDGRSLVPLPRRYKNQVRMVDNQLMPIYRTNLSLLLRNAPIHDLQAFTGDFVDEATAKVGRKLMRALLYATGQKRTNHLLFKELMRGGSGFKRPVFNDEGGPTTEVAVTEDGSEIFLDLKDRTTRPREEVAEMMVSLFEGDPEFEPDKRFVPITEPVYEGEVEVQVKSILEVVGDPACPFLQDSQMVFIEQARSLDFIRARFPEKGKYVRPETNTVILFDSSGGAEMLPGLELPRITGQSSNRQGSPDVAVVREVQIRPTAKNPLTGNPAPYGVHFVWAGNIALTDLDNPLPYAFTPETPDHDVDFDLVKYDWLLEDGFYSRDFFSDLLPMQRSWNRRTSQVAESINAFVHPKLQVAMGSKIRKSSFADVAGEVVEYAGVPASYLEPPNLAPHVFRNMDMIKQSMNDVAMTHEILREGRPPPNVRTAAGLRLLEEQDLNALGVTVGMFEESETIFGQKLLDRAKQFYEENRIIRYVGERNRLETEEFKRSAFFSKRWSVYVHPGSAFPASRAAKIAEANEVALNASWMFVDTKTGQPSQQRYARMIGSADWEDFLEDLDESRQAAEREHDLMEAGQDIEPFPFEDHATHLEEHTRYAQAPDFREKPEDVQQRHIAHMGFHEQFLAQAAQQAAQSQAMIQSAAMQGQQAVLEQNASAAAASSARAAAETAVQEIVDRQGQPQNDNADIIRTLMSGLGRQQ